ncbi:MAG: hypothetical protein VX527_07290, partial [Planctomycetota bacterium]|nr:hypothetical protein [Planctomycetota bacterium]
MIFRRGLIGLAGLLLAGGGWEVAAADRGQLDLPLEAIGTPLKPAPERIMTAQGLIRPEAMPMAVDLGMLRELRKKPPGQPLLLNNVLLEPGFAVNLEVTRVEPFAPGAQVVLMEADGKGGVREKKVNIPDQVILAGQVVGEPESRVVLGLAQDVCNGYISTESGLYLVASPADMDGPPVIYPVGDRAGAIEVMPKLFPVGVKDSGPEF